MKIVFTSCARYNKKHLQNEWLSIYDKDPDHLLLLGDNIYMDWGFRILQPKLRSIRYFKKRMQKMYDLQWSNPNFEKLRNHMNEKNGFHGIWDDHDCGWNNINVASLNERNKAKIAYSRQQLFEHFPLSKANNSIYYAHDTALARFIFLDNRTFSKKRSETFLGENQFAFIEEKLNHTKPITIICGGLTLSNGHENFSSKEKAYQRFCKLCNDAQSKVIYLAGDIHKNKFTSPNAGITTNGILPPFEIISSGIPVTFYRERKHNWAMLHMINENQVEVSFYKKGEKQLELSKNCTSQLNQYLLG